MITSEEWRPVVGFEGSYEVSNMGWVRSVDRYVDVIGRWGPERRRYAGRVMKPQIDSDSPYPRIVLSKKGKLKCFTLHSLVMSAFVGPCPDGLEICHRDNDSTNPRLDNLRYGTRLSNREDSRRFGTLAVGEQIAQHKLTEQQVREIRESKLSSNVLARHYPVAARQIRRIRNGEHWTHV